MRFVIPIVLFSLMLGGADGEVQRARDHEQKAGVMYRTDYHQRRKELSLGNIDVYPKNSKPAQKIEQKLRHSEDADFWERFLVVDLSFSLTPPPTRSPTPSTCPLRSIIEPIALPGTDLDDATTYQGQAFDWLCGSNFEGLSDDRIVQRYALGCIYFATYQVRTTFTDAAFGQGNVLPWLTSVGWVTDANECEWVRLACDEENMVTILDLFRNNLTGKMPAEIVLFKATLRILDVGENLIFADPTIATALGELTELVELFYDQTNFMSKMGIPAEIGNLTKLEVYDASETLYSGPLNGAPSTMSALQRMFLFGNELTGGVPADWSALMRLEFLEIQNNLLTEEIPASVCELPMLQLLVADCAICPPFPCCNECVA